MKTSSAQIDLFDDAPGYREALRPVSRKRQPAASQPAGWDDEEGAQRLEQTGRFRILRKLVPRTVIPRAESAYPNLAVPVDTETTGLDHAKDEVIEIGAVAFTHDNEGVIGDVVGVYSGLRQPAEPIPAEITRLTGITDQMVAGLEIDFAALDALVTRRI